MSAPQSGLQIYFGKNSAKKRTKLSPKVNCPVCQIEVEIGKINEHLDKKCLAQEEDAFNSSSCYSKNQSCEADNELYRFRVTLNPFCQKGKEKVSKRIGDKLIPPKLPSVTEDLYLSPEIGEFSHCEDVSRTDDISKLGSKNDCSLLDELEETSSKLEAIDEENIESHNPYFLSNFMFIIDTSLSCAYNVKLFNEEELRIVDIFRNMKTESQLLFVRLFLRKSGWFRCKKLSYPSISLDLSPLILELVTNDFLINESQLIDITETLNLLSASEVCSLAHSLQLVKDNKGKRLVSKKDCVMAILNYSNRQQSILSFVKKPSVNSIKSNVLSSAKKYLGECVKLATSKKDLFSRFFNLFMVSNYPSTMDDDADNAYQSLIYKLLLINKGEILYPSYRISETTEIFPSREAFIRYSDAFSLEDELSRLIEKKKFSQALPIVKSSRQELEKICSFLIDSVDSTKSEHMNPVASHLRRFTSEWVYTRMCRKSVEVLEKEGMHRDAVELLRLLLSHDHYCASSRGFCWERLAIDTERYLKDPAGALDCMKTALSDPFVRTGKRLGFFARATRICNSKKHQSLKAGISDLKIEKLHDVKEVTITASLCLDTSSSQRAVFQCSESADNEQSVASKLFTDVEQCALMHYKSKGYPKGVHAEGSSYTFIFSLLFWDIIFMDVPNVFVGPYQACPLDFLSDCFYETRKEEIDLRLTEIRTSSTQDLRNRIHDCWMQHKGHTCVGVNWKIFDTVEDIMDIVSCLQSFAIAGICELFCKDYKNRCSGMPDLLVWNPANRLCKAVEVKGPGDRLSHKQIIWLNILSSLGVDAETCHVKGIGGKRKMFMESSFDVDKKQR